VAAVAAALLATSLAACATVLNGTPHVGNAANANLHVVGGTDGPFDTTVKNALADIEAFWRRNYPKVSGGKPLPPLKGGLYSVSGLRVAETGTAYSPIEREKCIQAKAGFIVDNAAYCLLDDSIAWDRSPQHLFARLADHYGKLMIAMIFAHEFGHAISERLGVFKANPPTIDTESQADCAAGAWAGSLLRHEDPHFLNVTPRDIDDALEGYLDGRDKTPGTIAEISHGNGFDRLSALADGLDHGVRYCYSPHYFDRTFTERPFSSVQDYEAGGNAPLSDAIAPNSFLARDLNRFFTGAAKSVNKTFTPVKLVQTSSPRCGTASAQLLYCPATNSVQFTNAFAHAAYYSLPDINVDSSTGNVTLLFHQPADFALGELFATAWGLAVRHQLFARPLDDHDAISAAVCYTGAYAKDVNLAQNPGDKLLILSPADLDEAVSALLSRPLMNASFGERGTTGLDRIQAFVRGYNGGLPAC
jgi:predicted metalloprotease